MMLFLMIDVMINFFEIIAPEAQRAVSLLPVKLEPWSDVTVYTERSCAFDFPDEVADENSR